ncbi:MAG TPA: glucoamylase family protein, partial [Candidatus Dormibacteraeota bacterium]|nr:glucoamylase family protein [Candidatus Dormibacteraeota bacterium]
MPCLFGLIPRRKGISLRSHFRGIFSDFVLGISQVGLTLTFLAYQTWLMSSAILRTLFRLMITHRNLLEWVTAAQAKAQVDTKFASTYKRMAGGFVVVGAAAASLAFAPHGIWVFAGPFLLLWAAAPAAAWWISLPAERKTRALSVRGQQALRLIARRTWRFFEKFVTAENHALPPDNFQEIPKAVLAHRTSPTNIGLYLLSTVCARDLGWLGIVEMTERLEATLGTMREMELFRGHFYNWYDTSDLHPLTPKYVSTVDSGNLAGHLLALANGCRAIMEKSPFEAEILAGMQDTARLLAEVLARIPDTPRAHVVTRKQLGNAVDTMASSLEFAPMSTVDWADRFVEWKTLAQNVADIAQTLTQERDDAADSELPFWANALKACVESHARDARILIPLISMDTEDVAGLFREWPAESDALKFLHSVPTLASATDQFDAALRELTSVRNRLASDVPNGSATRERDTIVRVEALIELVKQSSADAAALTRRLLTIIQTAEHMVEAMEFGFLLDEKRKLLSIGYRVADGAPDSNYYDLLASEARLASFIAIAKGEAPATHWFHLGRALTPVKGGSALTSWSGSMFEYLMPALVMRSPEGSLLSETLELVVRRQAEYGAERGVPWGVSESAYNARDVDLTYQYASFGVPGLGLKRGLSDDLVVAPYATALAAMVDPVAALENFRRLEHSGAETTYGFYEALDYTATRLPEGKEVALVRTQFAHHQGMTLVALANVLNEGAMRSRFHAAPMVQATELLLQERTPRDVMV